MVNALELIGILKKEYPDMEMHGPDEYGWYDGEISAETGTISIGIRPGEWIPSMAMEVRDRNISESSDDFIKLLKRFPEDYEVEKAIVSLEDPDNYDTIKHSAPGYTAMVMKENSSPEPYRRCITSLIGTLDGEFDTEGLLENIKYLKSLD